MKKHLLGFCIAFFAFSGGFYISPIRFIDGGAGSGATRDGADWCSFSDYSSNHFVKVHTSSCDYKTAEKAKENIIKKVDDAAEIVEFVKEVELQDGRNIHRAVTVLNFNGLQYFCLNRADENWVNNVCSTSLRHVKEFEQKRFKD